MLKRHLASIFDHYLIQPKHNSLLFFLNLLVEFREEVVVTIVPWMALIEFLFHSHFWIDYRLYKKK